MPNDTGGPARMVGQWVDDLLSRLTLPEKVALLSGQDRWQTAAIERLGLPAIVLRDGSHGVRARESGDDHRIDPTTAFPTGVAMAASWDPELIERVGAALAEEAQAVGCDVVLGPCVNIVRTPLAGRNFESYSEDPYLAGRIAVAWINGLQSRGIGAAIKHFACNNQETERLRGNSVVDRRPLREIYLPAFEAAVKEARPWCVISAYNRVNGVFASEHHELLKQILRREWGFDGAVISDWGGTHTTLGAIAAGLDLEMPGPPKYYGNLLADAVGFWQVDAEVVDRAAQRILTLVVRCGRMDEAEPAAGSVNTPEHQRLARELAEQSITLLKNDPVILPIDAARARSIAVFGPNADRLTVGGGGSSEVTPPYRVTPLQALRSKAPGHLTIHYLKGCDNFVEPPGLLGGEDVTPAVGEGQGLWADYFAGSGFSGPPVLQRAESAVNCAESGYRLPDALIGRPCAVRWTGTLTVRESGPRLAQFLHTDTCRLFLDDELVLESARSPANEADRFVRHSAQLDLRQDRPYRVRVEFSRSGAESAYAAWLHFGPAPDVDLEHQLEQAAALASRCDMAIACVGMPERFEREGADRPHMDLPRAQDTLISTIAAANPNTVVVLNCGAPVAMPWLEDVAAVVQMYYPGLEGGNALADILLGRVNPSGKLSVSYPRRLEDAPARIDVPGTRDVRYDEGVFVGYRHYDTRGMDVLFPFGHGLSYTTFEYRQARAPATAKPGEAVTVSVAVRNTGRVAGREVVQVYVQDRQASVPRPLKELKAFAKVALQPGEEQRVEFTLEPRAFAFYDSCREQWLSEPGDFDILIGASSRDIRAVASVELLT